MSKKKEEPQPQDQEAASPASVPSEASEPEQLKEKIALLEAEAAKLRDQWIRAAAETENVRKRMARDQENISRYAVTNFAREMVSVLENLNRASGSIPQGARKTDELLNVLAEGVDLTLKEMLAILEKHGIQRIDPEGQAFDHNLHQAVAQIERDDVAPGTVVQVVQAGYRIHDRLLRPAMVAVAKAPAAPKTVDTSA